MRVLTLPPVEAELVAAGVKWTDTSRWNWQYRGDVLVAASRRRLPAVGTIRDDVWGDASREIGDYLCRAPNQIIHRSTGVELHATPGRVVAVARLADVVPISRTGDTRPGPHFVCDYPHEGELTHQQGGLWLIGTGPPNHGSPTRIEEQRPYSARWHVGEYAALLTDIRYIPRGQRIEVDLFHRNRLWTPDPGFAAAALATVPA